MMRLVVRFPRTTKVRATWRRIGVVALSLGVEWMPGGDGARAEMSYVTEWGSFGSGPTQFDSPTGIALSPGGDVYVSDSGNNRISRFGPDGQFVASYGALGGGAGQFREPNHLQFSPTNGDLYVTDLGNARIQRLTPDGDFVLAWGSQGQGPGQFLAPWGIHVDAAGDVWVACRDQTRIQKFTEDGAFLEQWGAPGLFPKPHGIVTDADGNVYVSDVIRHDVQKFDALGGYLLQWGSPGSDPGQFLHPHHLTYIGGEIVVVDWLEHPHGGRLTSFTTSGELSAVLVSGSQGTAPLQFHTIFQAATDGLGTWYVIEWGNHRVQKMGDVAVGAGTLPEASTRPRPRVGDPYPNPSRGVVRIPMQLPASGGRSYDVSIHDARGARILARTLTAEDLAAALVWNGSDAGGRVVGAGVYFVTVSGGDVHETKRVVRVR
jgi:DNA-binding beta-propeller fold protein YncE